MSNGKKPNKKAEQPAEEIEEAIIVPPQTDETEEKPEEPAEAAEVSDDGAEADTAEDDAPVSDEPPVLEGEALSPEEGAADTADAADASEEVQAENTAADQTEETNEPAPTPVAPLPPEQVIVKQGGFLPLFLGGMVAAGIGFGLARYVIPDWPAGSTDTAAKVEEALAAPKKDIAALSGRVDALESGPDLSGLTGQVEEATAGLSTRLDGLSKDLDTLKAQLDELASRPNMAASASEAVAAYEAQMEALRAEVADMTKAAQAEKAAAEMTEREAMLRNSLTRVRIALDEGTPFPDELANIEAAGMDVPQGLSAVAQSGAPTLAALQESYAPAARNALAAARKGTGGSVSGVMTRILGVRSLEPREGNDPDAVLSRAEAALKEARLSDALAEIDALPEAAKAELAEWSAQATERTAALAGADALGQELNKD